MAHPFLSDEWMIAARDIRERYAAEVPEVSTTITINLVVTEVPFGEGEVRCHIDTSSGSLVLELGQLEDAPTTISTDYGTAKALFVDQDQAIAMQAFMTGKIVVQGDMMQMLAMQTAVPINDFSETIADEVRAITADG